MKSSRVIFKYFKREVNLLLAWVTGGQIQVRGLYHYRNRFPLPLSFSLALPFPADAGHPTPSLFTISEVLAADS